MKELSTVEAVNREINTELSSEAVSRALLATTFKGLTPIVMRQALMDGMIRGFTFKDFREKNVYAIPFGKEYSLVTSIDYSRKIGMRSGIVGKMAPVYEVENGKILSCSVTVKRKIKEYVGEYTATVYFAEYDKGTNLWKTKPRTMIAKVAEMHALRMACPEELSQQYIEEEMREDEMGIVGDRLPIAVKVSESLKTGNLDKNAKKDKNKIENAESAKDSFARDEKGGETGEGE